MTTTGNNSTAAEVDNGVNVSALLGAREALEKAPEAAQFKWRASCEWLNGTHSRSAIGTFFGLGAEQSRNKTFTVEADHPQVFASEDNAPTPVELVLGYVLPVGMEEFIDCTQLANKGVLGSQLANE